MNISTFGAKHFLGGLNSLIEEFRVLGHNVDEDIEPDFIYSSDLGGYKDSISLWGKFNKKPKIILNCLDLPYHLKDFNKVLEEYRLFLPLADKITTISYKVRKDIKDYLNLDAEVIYYPIRPVKYIPNIPKTIDFFINGRVLDPNKRGFLAEQVADSMGKNLFCAGSDYLPSAYNLGIIDDKNLCLAYNNTKITLVFGKIEGIGLQMIESLICLTPIICLSDNKTNYEFAPPEMICDPDLDSIISKVNDILERYDYYKSICIEYSEKYKKQFSPSEIVFNILKIHESIK